MPRRDAFPANSSSFEQRVWLREAVVIAFALEIMNLPLPYVRFPSNRCEGMKSLSTTARIRSGGSRPWAKIKS